MHCELSARVAVPQTALFPRGLRIVRPFCRGLVAGNFQPCFRFLPQRRNGDVCPACTCGGFGLLCGALAGWLHFRCGGWESEGRPACSDLFSRVVAVRTGSVQKNDAESGNQFEVISLSNRETGVAMALRARWRFNWNIENPPLGRLSQRRVCGL